MPAPDAVTLATVWHAFQTACREMRHLIEKTAQSYLIGQLKDVSVGIWLADGSTVAVPQGLLSQFIGTRFSIQSIREKFEGNLYPGDVILTNDPYHGGHTIHLPDWGFMRPIFYEDELLFFTLVRGHMMDTGGSFPGGYFPNAHDIHAEGICIPPLKIYERGQEKSDLLELIWNNVRFPQAMRIDAQSMMAATKLAENRTVALCRRYGKDTVLSAVREMISRTERAVRAEIASIPAGTYSGEAATDDDGTVLDEPVWVRVDLTVKGDEMILDFSRSDKQRKGFVNCIYAATYAVAVGTTLLQFDPALSDFHNEGSLRPVTVIAPPGSVLNAQYPATVGASPVNMGVQIIEAVAEAMAKARPERALSAWNRHRGDYTFAVDHRTGGRYVRTSFDYDGSAGAVWGHDGPTGPTARGTLASVIRGNVEESEVRYPWRQVKLEIATDFMGAGCWRGGGGIDWRAVNLGGDGGMATGSSDGDEMTGKGLLGGHPVPKSRTFFERNGQLMRLKPHRLHELKHGDVLIKLSAGGAGVGDPRQRPAEKVLEDVRSGIVSRATARLIYGVVIDPERLSVDQAATAALRAAADAAEYRPVLNEETLTAELKPAATPAAGPVGPAGGAVVR